MKDYSKYYNYTSFWRRFIQLLQFPLYLFCKFIPKKNIILFGSNAGYRIADNSKYKFIHEYNSNFYYIIKRKALLNEPIFDNVYPVYALSLKGIMLQIFAKEVYYSHNIYDFTSPLIMGAHITMLGHGYHTKTWRRNFGIKGFIGKYIFPYTNPDFCHAAYCPSKNLEKQYKNDFDILKPEIIIKDLPRLYYAPKRQKERKILYAPTFRGYRNFIETVRAINILDKHIGNILNENMIKLTIRPHPVDIEFIKNISNRSRGIHIYSADNLFIRHI
jgi:hypothetical protein